MSLGARAGNAAVLNLARYLGRPEVRRQPVRLISRRLRYEWERRLTPSRLARDRQVRFDGDLRLLVRMTEDIERSVYLYGLYEYRTASVFISLLRPGMTVLDVGAHIGQFTLLAAGRVGGQGRVIAFEPNPENRHRLRRNLALNRMTAVEVLPVALSETSGSARLHIPEVDQSSGMGSLRPPEDWAQDFMVQTERLDTMAARLQLRALDLMKVDVEGLESQVFRGGAELLREFRPAIIFEVNDLYAQGSRVSAPAIDQLRGMGYEMFGILLSGEGRIRLEPLPAGQDPARYREPWYALNLVALHPNRSGGPPELAGQVGRRTFDTS